MNINYNLKFWVGHKIHLFHLLQNYISTASIGQMTEIPLVVLNIHTVGSYLVFPANNPE